MINRRNSIERHDSTPTLAESISVAVVLLAVMGTALGVVYSRHEARVLFIELQRAQLLRDELTHDWDRLQLEEGTYATHSMVERKARSELGMAMPTFDQVEHVGL